MREVGEKDGYWDKFGDAFLVVYKMEDQVRAPKIITCLLSKSTLGPNVGPRNRSLLPAVFPCVTGCLIYLPILRHVFQLWLLLQQDMEPSLLSLLDQLWS